MRSERINKTMRELERPGVENLNLCHCSGINNMVTGSVREVQCQDYEGTPFELKG